jgi:hypothetical protein
MDSPVQGVGEEMERCRAAIKLDLKAHIRERGNYQRCSRSRCFEAPLTTKWRRGETFGACKDRQVVSSANAIVNRQHPISQRTYLVFLSERKTPDIVHKEIWTHLLAYNLLPTVMAVASDENDTEPRKVSFRGAKQALTAFAPKIEASRPEERGPLIDAMLTTIAYHRVGDRPGRWEPRARRRRPKPGTRLTQPRYVAKLPHNRSKWFWSANRKSPAQNWRLSLILPSPRDG